MDRPNLPTDIVDLLSNLPGADFPVGSVYAPLLRKPLSDFPYARQDVFRFNLLGVVDRAHLHTLAEAVTQKVGKRYSAVPIQVLYEKVFVDTKTLWDQMREIAAHCWAPAREAIVGRKVFSDPKVRYVEGEYIITGRSSEVDINKNDALSALEEAGSLKFPDGAKISRGKFWANPASLWARWNSGEEAFYADARAPSDVYTVGVALLYRTDEVQEA